MCFFSRVLIGVTESSSAEDVSSLLSSTGVDLLISRVLSSASEDGMKYAQSVQTLYSSQSQNKLAWSMGRPAEGHLASLVGPVMVKLYQLMLLTLPGTPFINYGDEIGLMDEVRTVSLSFRPDRFTSTSLLWKKHHYICLKKEKKKTLCLLELTEYYFWFQKG